MGHSATGGPPAIATFRSSLFVKNPIQRPSGERNGLRAPVMPRSGTASSPAIARTINCRSAPAT